MARPYINPELKDSLTNRHVILRCGHGCYLHTDCFTCPFPDCQASVIRLRTPTLVAYFNGEGISGVKRAR